MLVSKKTRVAIYSYLFKEGVLVVKKDFSMNKHPEIEAPLLHVNKLMLSLASRNYVREQFNWRYHYWFLTNEGIEYLRDYLHIPTDTVPATLKKSTKPQPAPSFGQRSSGERGGRGRGRGRGRGGAGGDRDDYRGKKDGSAPRDFNPEFESGRPRFDGERGRGRGRGTFRGGRGRGRGRGGAVGAGAPAGDAE